MNRLSADLRQRLGPGLRGKIHISRQFLMDVSLELERLDKIVSSLPPPREPRSDTEAFDGGRLG